MAESGTSVGALGARASDPIAVELYDDGSTPALYIDDGSAPPALHVALHNQSVRDIELAAKGAVASTNAHHVELRFRPGVLSRRTLAALGGEHPGATLLTGAAGAWDLRLGPVGDGMPQSVYLLHTGTDRLLASDERRILTLHGMSAVGAQGARPTQVQVSVRAINFRGSDATLSVTRHRHLSLVHSGRSDVPLRAGFPGSSVLVNDGKVHEPLVLHILNTSSDETLRSVPGAEGRPVFTLRFDVGGAERWWALGDAKEVQQQAQIDVRWPDAHDFVRVPSASRGLDPDPCWPMPLPAGGLGPRQHVEIRVGGIQTVRKGSTNVYVEYENIAGFRHGTLLCSMSRVPRALEDLVASVDRLTTDLGDLTKRVTHSEGRLDVWAKDMDPVDDRGQTKLRRDLDRLKSETYVASAPPTFPPNCAYGRPQPPFMPLCATVVHRLGEAAVKFAGYLDVPSLRRALQSGESDAVLFPLPDQATTTETDLTAYLVPHRTFSFVQATFKTKTMMRDRAYAALYLTKVDVTKVDLSATDVGAMVLIGFANLDYYK